jgi:DELLA protein
MFQHLKIDGWRANFAKLGMVEEELSTSSFYQAELVLQNFASGNLCTLDRNGKCLITVWRGTPILSVSAWRFHQQEQKRKGCTKKYKSC